MADPRSREFYITCVNGFAISTRCFPQGSVFNAGTVQCVVLEESRSDNPTNFISSKTNAFLEG